MAMNPSSGSITEDQAFEQISQYPLDGDDEWLIGLASILGHPGSPPTTAEIESNQDLIAQAQCFYVARKLGLPQVDASRYVAWKRGRQEVPRPEAPTPQIAAKTGETQVSGQSGVEPPPPYPTSFAEIVDLITQNKPIPGIEEVPDTVLDLGSSKQDNAVRRKKPWEKDEMEVVKSEAVDVESTKRSGEGVMKILQSNAVPDSGLIARE